MKDTDAPNINEVENVEKIIAEVQVLAEFSRMMDDDHPLSVTEEAPDTAGSMHRVHAGGSSGTDPFGG